MHICHIAVPNSVDEQREIENSHGNAESVAIHLSQLKAKSVAHGYPDHFILGMDTVVVINGTIIGKPRDEKNAFRILRTLSGNWHVVITGLTLYRRQEGYSKSRAVSTRVKFLNLTDDQIRSYIKRGESLDKAGAYGIQSAGSALVEKIEGDFSNIVGFPEQAVIAMLREAGIYDQIKKLEGTW